MIGVLDYGVGNIGSILNMIKKVGAEGIAVQTATQADSCAKLILPGAGAFDTGVTLLERSGLWDAVQNAHSAGKPILGICLGMQLLGRSSEEGTKAGLGLLPFDGKKFQMEAQPELRVPHMGWNEVSILQKDAPLTQGLESNPRFYFVHSYYAVCDTPSDVFMTCNYGGLFAAAVHRDNVWGVQFHPEKSHRFGMGIMRNFAKECM